MKTNLISSALYAVGAITFTIAFGSNAHAIETSWAEVQVPAKDYVQYEGSNPLFKDGFLTGFGSALALKEVKDDGTVVLYGLTDRGPNADGPNVIDENGKVQVSKYFPTPKFNPQVGVISFKDGLAHVDKIIHLKNADGSLITGLPIHQGLPGSTLERALDDNNQMLGFDDNGLDTEGLVFDKDGNMWISDEYGPFLMKFSPDGVLEEKYWPGNGLPEILKYRTPNRGAEGVSILPNGKLVLMEQSVLNIKRGDKKSGNTASFCRVVIFDPLTHEVKTVGYPINTDYKKPGDAKLGDITVINDHEFLIIEQAKDKNKKMQNRIYRVDFSKADDLTNALKDGLEPEFFKDAGGFKLAKKQLLVDLREYGWDIEKAEGLVVLPDEKTLIVTNDNDFGLELKVHDTEHKKAKIKDYTLNQDKSFSFDGKKADVKLEFTHNADSARVQKLMTIKLDHKL